MSDTVNTSIGPNPEELSDDELLERIAALDEDEFDSVAHARRALSDQEGSS
jgi:hypothetical protein